MKTFVIPNVFALSALAFACTARADTSPKSVYESASRSLVIIQYAWDFELGRREVNASGIALTKDGLIMCSSGVFDERVPEKQIHDVKVIVPRPGLEPLELDAEYQGRDDRAHLAFVKVIKKYDFTPMVISTTPCDVGDPFYSIGLMGKPLGYKPFLVHGTVAAAIPAEQTQMLVDGTLAGVGSPILDLNGQMIGFVASQPQPAAPREGQSPQPPQSPNTFTPIAECTDSIAHPPTPAHPVVLPWFGVFEMNGLKQEELAYYGLSGPAAQVTAVAPGGPAEKAGLKQGDLIVKVDGKTLDPGDTPAEVPALLRRRLLHDNPGDTVVMTVVSDKGEAPHEVSVKLGSAPSGPSLMDRCWADNLGMGVRDLTYLDRYLQHLSPDAAGVIVAVVKPDGPAASMKLQPNVLVLEMNGKPVTNVAEFGKDYAALRAAQSQDPVVLVTRREGHDETVRIEPNK